MNKGFIKLSRKSFAHKFWTKARILSEFEAWIDLIQSARYDETVKIEYIDGREIKYGRGQYPASIRFLAKKWNWGEQKVRTFLSELKKDGSITTDSKQGMNIITLCKYDIYNSAEFAENTANNTVDNIDVSLILNEIKELKTQVATQQITQSQHSDNTNSKKEKKEKKDINPKGYEKFSFEFLESEFKEVFYTWLEYKRARKESYKTDASLKACYNQLKKLSNNDPSIAIQIVDQSMANDWKGLFELKEQKGDKNEVVKGNSPRKRDYSVPM